MKHLKITLITLLGLWGFSILGAQMHQHSRPQPALQKSLLQATQQLIQHHTNWQWDGIVYTDSQEKRNYVIIKTYAGQNYLKVMFAPKNGQLITSMGMYFAPPAGANLAISHDEQAQSFPIQARFDHTEIWSTTLRTQLYGGREFYFYAHGDASIREQGSQRWLSPLEELKNSQELVVSFPLQKTQDSTADDTAQQPSPQEVIRFNTTGFQDIFQAMQALLL